MNRTWRTLTLIAMALAALLLLATIIILGGLILIPPLDQASLAPLEVSIRQPIQGGQVGPGTVEVEAMALGSQPVTAMTLWVDGLPSASATLQFNEEEVASARFEWTPANYGQHVLIVRAEDQGGYAALSTPVIVQVSPPPAAPPQIITVTAAEGEAAQDIAAAFGLPPESLLPYNPGLDPASPLMPSQSVVIPLLEPPALPLPFTPPTASVEPLDFGLGVTAGPAPADPAAPGTLAGLDLLLPWTIGALPAPPAAPGLSAEASECSAALTIQDNSADEMGFTIYRLSGASPGFEPLATLGALEGAGLSFEYSDNPASDAIYYVAAFNAAGEAAGGIAAVDRDPACAENVAPASFNLSNAQILPTDAYEKAYCYVGAEAGLWQRLPADAGAFLLPNPDGSFSLGAALPALPGEVETLALECWGWQNGNLQSMGAAVGDLPALGEQLILDGSGFQFSASLAAALPLLTLQPGGPVYAGFPPQPNIVVTPPHGVEVFYDGPSNLIELRWAWMQVSCFPGSADCPEYASVAGFKLYGQDGKLILVMDDPAQRSVVLSAVGTSAADACYFLTSVSAEGYESTPSALGCAIPPEISNPFALSSERLGYPYELRVISDPAACTEAFQGASKVIGALLCQGAVDSSLIILRWTWAPATWCQPSAGCDPISKPDGYYVYEYIGGQPVLAETIDDPQQVVTFMPNPTQGQGVNLSDMCYTVVAYSGDLRSQPSETICAEQFLYNLDGPQAFSPDRVRGSMSTYLSRIKTIGSDIEQFNFFSGEQPVTAQYGLFRLTKYRNLTAGPDIETTVNVFSGLEFGWRLDDYSPEQITAATLTFSADGLLYEGEPDETASFLSDLNNAIPYVPDPLGFLVNIALTSGTNVSLDEYELVGAASCIAHIGYGDGLFLTRASQLNIEDGPASNSEGGLFLVEEGQISGPLTPGDHSFDVLEAVRAGIAARGRFWVSFSPPIGLNEKTNTLCNGTLHDVTLHLTINQ